MNPSSTTGQNQPASTPAVETTPHVVPAPTVAVRQAVAVAASKPAIKKEAVAKTAVKPAAAKKVVLPVPKTPASKTAVTPKASKAVVTRTPAVKAPVAKKAAPLKVGAPVKTAAKPALKKQVAVKAPARPAPTAPIAPNAAKSKVRKSISAGTAMPADSKAVDTVSPKAKLVRDSFTMPQRDFALIAILKDRALGFKRPTKKSELLRAGLHALAKLNAAALRAALESLIPLPTGRPKNASR